MAPTARPEGQTFALGLAGIALVTLWRVALLPFDSADLFVDDAQYWFWGQTLDWGYYSKPPLIAWILRLSTTLGSDAPFFIRLPLPLIHAATAVLVALIARRLWGARIGGIAGFAFASLPAVALGSLLVSTDTPMLACFALAMLAQLHLAERRSLPWALVLGAAVGTGLMAKYAMIYFPLSAALAALLLPAARIAWRDAAAAALIALLDRLPQPASGTRRTSSPPSTTPPTTPTGSGPRLDLAGPRGLPRRPVRRLRPGLLRRLPRRPRPARRTPPRRYLALMSLPILAIVSVQALVSGANANWAAAAHLAALVLAAAVLVPHPRLLATGLAINLAVTLALPVAAVFADSWRIGSGNLVLARYVGQADLSRHAAEIARAEGLDTLVSGNRAMLADFFYTLRDAGLAIYAEPVEGFPPHHYAQKHPLPPGPGDVLYITRSATGPACRAPAPVARGRPLAAGAGLHHPRASTPSACRGNAGSPTAEPDALRSARPPPGDPWPSTSATPA